MTKLLARQTFSLEDEWIEAGLRVVFYTIQDIFAPLAPVVQNPDNFIHWISHDLAQPTYTV